MTERNMGEESQGSGKLGKADRRKKRYRALFLDLDNTLLDFDASESEAFKKVLVRFGMKPEDEFVREYHQINRQCWELFEEGKLEKGAEYLSGMKREDRLLPVITIVFYYGEEQSWDGPLYLHDMLDIPPELEPWAACIQDYRVNLVCSGTVESSHFRTGLREVFELLPLLKDKEGMKKFLETRKREFMHLDAKRGWLVSKFLNVPALKDLKENEKGEVNICTAIEEMLEER